MKNIFKKIAEACRHAQQKELQTKAIDRIRIEFWEGEMVLAIDGIIVRGIRAADVNGWVKALEGTRRLYIETRTK